jgi:adenosine deaminase
MCKSDLHDFLCALPKVEHHLHIEGTLEPDLLFHLAEKNHISLPSPSTDPAWQSPDALKKRYQNFTSLDDFLSYYFIGMTTLITASDFELLAYTYFTKAHSQNVHHAEIFFDPQAHVSRGVAYSTILKGLHAAQARAEKEFNLTTLLIPCLLRHFSPEDCTSFYHQHIAPSLQTQSVTGLGLSSTEKNRPPTLFTEPFAHASAQGYNLTAHAGEEGPASYMTSALSTLHVTRIDHGVALGLSATSKSTEDDNTSLLTHFADSTVLLTMCPISNIVLRVTSHISSLPIRTYLDAGVRFSINSDDPAYFGSNYIQENYCAVQEAFGLKKEEWNTICRWGIEGSWCDEGRKEELFRLLEEVDTDSL